MKINNGYALKGPYFKKNKSLLTQPTRILINKHQPNLQCNSNDKQALALAAMKSIKSHGKDATIPPLNLLHKYHDNRIKSKKSEQFDNNPYQHTDVSTVDAIDDILSSSMLFQAQVQTQEPLNVNSKRSFGSLLKISAERINVVTKSNPTNERHQSLNDKRNIVKGLVRNNTHTQSFKQYLHTEKSEIIDNDYNYDISYNDYSSISNPSNDPVIAKTNKKQTIMPSSASVSASAMTMNKHRRTISLNLPLSSSSKFQTIISYADLLRIEDNLNDILSVLTLNHPPENQCLQWWTNSFGSSLKENYSEYFMNESNRRIIHCYSTIELLSVMLCYILSTNKEVFKAYIEDFRCIFASLHLNLLLLIKFIITQQKGNDSFYDKINHLIKKSLTSINEKDIDEFIITSLITHNVNTISVTFLKIIKNAFKDSDYEELIYNFFSNAYNNKHCIKPDALNSFFNKEILKDDVDKKDIPSKPNVPFLSLRSKYAHTIVLDLDETLVHLIESNEDKSSSTNRAAIDIRPGLFEFLKGLKNKFEVVLFTAAIQDYADVIIDIIESKEKYFDYRLYREHTVNIGNEYIKDLRKLGRDITKIVIVDDKPQNYSLQKENGILIQPFYGQECYNDTLGNLGELLIKIFNEGGDVRIAIAKYKQEIDVKITMGR